ncbi:hypothetical protein A3C89_02165 [Candidatus Kaiserbacteria bacterium RIFCSPHIGHO2_02_FULL_50_50]|uniref:Uncharacterized protein n=1 Tax=Candidatus Kaiserbacteria bacterium RIFCSPHIGHO2_02_FULL_50_50 TaxID=1798492 RepID=A0A1F6DFH5_9BACT|nr:MAG: hypothetical protein A3C89_02165 [Candidatus Kaiserbacteria bacterium RIFCSPHIGHO2_02_FULL_50_50]OGG88606.1 MAG: hypothetical protein A3G62_00710 [Candidatus Kaiserbacteria bacterium RIFCSPLOWO2_12_FULL_50_10]
MERKYMYPSLILFGSLLLVILATTGSSTCVHRNTFTKIGETVISYKVVDNATLALYSEVKNEEWHIPLKDACAATLLSDTLIQTPSELHTIHDNRDSFILKKIADISDTPARNVDSNTIVIGKQVFMNGTEVLARDAQTLTRISPEEQSLYNEVYYKDSVQVYVREVIPNPLHTVLHPFSEVDPATFEVIPDSDYVKDKNAVYYKRSYMYGTDPETFAVLREPDIGKPSLRMRYKYPYAKDKNGAYFEGNTINSADIETFTPLYEKGETVGKTFDYARDKNSVFYHETTIKGADPDTFQILWHYIYEGCNADQYAKDKNAVYYKHLPLIGADPATFEATDNILGKDKHGYWEHELLKPEITEPRVCEFA